jgi:hypothetical protein
MSEGIFHVCDSALPERAAREARPDRPLRFGELEIIQHEIISLVFVARDNRGRPVTHQRNSNADRINSNGPGGEGSTEAANLGAGRVSLHCAALPTEACSIRSHRLRVR